MALLDQSLALLLTVAGAALCIVEALAPGAHFIVLGVALLVAGLVGLTFPPLGTPLALAFLVLAVGAASLYGYRRFDLYTAEGGIATTRGSTDLVGEEGIATERVTPTEGQVRLRNGGFDPVYSARAMSETIPEGAEVIVLDAGGGSILTVETVGALDSIDRELAREREREREGERESSAESDERGTESLSDEESERERA
jgi:membrane protein implicated in regulation of membrane protease activity